MKIACVLFAGGRGTRLRPLTYIIPKPLLPISFKTRFIDLALEQCEKLRKLFQVTVFVATAYNHGKLSNYLRKHHPGVALLHDTEPLGTLGSLWQHRQQIINCKADLLLALPTDYLFRSDISESIYSLTERDYECLLYCSRSHTDKDYVAVDSNGTATRITSRQELNTSLAYMGMIGMKLRAMDQVLYQRPRRPEGLKELAAAFIRRKTAGVYELPSGAIKDLGIWPRYLKQLFSARTVTN